MKWSTWYFGLVLAGSFWCLLIKLHRKSCYIYGICDAFVCVCLWGRAGCWGGSRAQAVIGRAPLRTARATCVWGAGLSHLISILRDWHCPHGHNAGGHYGLLKMKCNLSRQCCCQSALTWAGPFIPHIVYLCNHSLHKCKLISSMFWLTRQGYIESFFPHAY